MENFNWHKFESIKGRLAVIIDEIVDRHRTAGAPLTWRLLHEIEAEAMAAIRQAPDVDQAYVDKISPLAGIKYPRTDDPVDFGRGNALPLAFTLIKDSFSFGRS